MLRRIAVALAVAVVLTACSTSSAPMRAKTSSAAAGVETPGLTYYSPGDRKAVPAVDAVTLAGGHLALRDLLGRDVVVLNVWASWCTECRAESRGLGRLSSALRKTGAQFVGVDEQDIASKARAFAAAARVDYPQLVDPYGTLLAKLTMLPSDGIPSTLVIDAKGRVAARIIGAADELQLGRLVRRVAEGH